MRRSAAATAVALALTSLAACSHHAPHASRSTNPTVGGTSSTTVHYTGDPHSRFCSMLGQLEDDPTSTENQTKDPSAVRAGMTRYRSQLDQLDQAAPADIEPDIHVLDKGFGDLDDALASVGYSWDQLGSADHALDVQSEINDPAFTTAGDHVSAYKAQVCHL